MILNKSINVLLFPCGSEIALEIYNSLSVQKNIKILGASSTEDNGRFVFENYISGVPMVNSDDFIEAMKTLVKKNNIDFIYPCMDSVITKLKRHENEIGCVVLSSPIETIEIISRKSLTYESLKGVIRTPKILNSNTPEFPMFSKPDIGASSRGTMKVEDYIDLQYSLKQYPNNLMLEYLPGDEYTVDCFTDKNGNLLFVGPRIRARISNGISVGVQKIEDPKINEIANRINETLSFTGAWFFQLKKDINCEYCLLEIAARLGGSSVMNRIRGVNFAYLTLLNEYTDVQILHNDYTVEVGRSLDVKTITSLSYDRVYIDFDDTLIVNRSVNTDAIKFIYNCQNRGIDVILLTKHVNPIEEALDYYKIQKSIFSQIIQINQEDKKYKYMDSNRSIFIDDSHKERTEVHHYLQIPVISVENIKHI